MAKVRYHGPTLSRPQVIDGWVFAEMSDGTERLVGRSDLVAFWNCDITAQLRFLTKHGILQESDLAAPAGAPQKLQARFVAGRHVLIPLAKIEKARQDVWRLRDLIERVELLDQAGLTELNELLVRHSSGGRLGFSEIRERVLSFPALMPAFCHLLWRRVPGERPIRICANSRCGRSFIVTHSARKYCDPKKCGNNRRQRDFKKRKKSRVEADLGAR